MPILTTCLIPFFNESARLVQVLESLRPLAPEVDFLCVNDGSTDNSVSLLSKHFPNIPLLHLPTNQGKSAAVTLGILQITTPYTLLFDADIWNFSIAEITAGLDIVKQATDIDMLIFRQANDPLLWKLLNFDLYFSGERIVATRLLQKVLTDTTTGYELELALNSYMLQTERNIVSLPFHSRNRFKAQKWGKTVGLAKSLQLLIHQCQPKTILRSRELNARTKQIKLL